MDFSQILKHLRLVASSGGGRALVFTLLILAALLTAVRVMLWSNTLDPLEGNWKLIYNLAILLFFFLLAAGIASLLWPRSVGSSKRAPPPPPTDNSWFAKNGRASRWSRRVVLMWGLAVGLTVYGIGWYMIWNLASPVVRGQQAVTDVVSQIIMPLVIVSMWLIMPFMFYLEFNKDRNNTKGKNTLRTKETNENVLHSSKENTPKVR